MVLFYNIGPWQQIYIHTSFDSCLSQKYWIKFERLLRDKHSSLFVRSVNDKEKSFIISTSDFKINTLGQGKSLNYTMDKVPLGNAKAIGREPKSCLN